MSLLLCDKYICSRLEVHTHVTERSADRFRCAPVRQPLGQAEIDQLNVGDVVQEDILRLEIPVDYAGVMKEI